MATVKLDAAFAANAVCPPGKRRIDYYDSGEICKGLMLEVRPNGKTWYVRYPDQYGGQHQDKIARYGEVTFDQARKKAREVRSEALLGGNPAAQKAALRATLTYGELATKHLADAKTYQRSYVTTEMYMRVHILPRWGKFRLSEIVQPDVAKWLAEKQRAGLAPATVEKIRAIFGRSFELALQWELPGVTRNPAKGIRRPPLNNARERFLTPEEAQRLQAAVANSRNKQLKYIVGLLLLTGARVSELLNAEWRYVDLERRSWLIPTSKTGKARYVPLSQAAVDVIEQLPRFNGCPYLLPNPQTRKPFTCIKHPWDTARREARLPDLRIHDLRHSAASFMINSGVDLFAVGRILGHASYQSTQRYSHLANDTLLAAVEAGAKKQAVDWSGNA